MKSRSIFLDFRDRIVNSASRPKLRACSLARKRLGLAAYLVAKEKSRYRDGRRSKKSYAKISFVIAPSPITKSSKNPSAKSASNRLTISSTRSTQLDQTSSRQTTSCGHSSLEVQEEVSQQRDTLSKEEEIGETDNNTSTSWSQRCFDSIDLFKSYY